MKVEANKKSTKKKGGGWIYEAFVKKFALTNSA
jgi:hypothetical protein